MNGIKKTGWSLNQKQSGEFMRLGCADATIFCPLIVFGLICTLLQHKDLCYGKNQGIFGDARLRCVYGHRRKNGHRFIQFRMWFIYISFLTVGSPVIVYMVMAFVMNIRRYMLHAKRNPLRYL